MFKGHKFNLLITIFFGLCLVILITFLGFRSLETSKRLAVDKFNEKQLILAERGANGIKLYLDSLTRETIAIAEADVIKDFLEDEIRVELSRRFIELKPLGVTEIKVIDSDGYVMYAVADRTLERKNVSENKYFNKASSADDYEEVFIETSDSFNKDDSTNIVTISSPVYSRSGFSGVVALDLNFNILSSRQLRPLESTVDGQTLLLDKDYQILWSQEKKIKGRSISKNFLKFDKYLKELSSGETRLIDFTDLDINDSLKEINDSNSVEYFFAIAPVQMENTIWFLAIGAPKGEALLSLTNVVNNILLMVSIIVTLIVTGATFFIIYLVRAGTRLERDVNSRTKQLRESEDNFRRIAEILQEALVAPIFHIPSLNVAAGYKAAYKPERVGGDFYDVFPVDNGKIALLIGDVAGKGVEAAGFTETIRSTIRAHATIDYSPSYVLAKTSESLIGRIKYFEYATTLYAILDVNDQSLRIASAGHPPIIVFEDVAEYIYVKAGMPFGQMIGEYEETEVQLNEQTGILLYTDGLLEARRGRDFFGEYRIKEIIENNFHLGSQELVDELLLNVMEFTDGEVDDDIALVVVRFSTSKYYDNRNAPLRFPLVHERKR